MIQSLIIKGPHVKLQDSSREATCFPMLLSEHSRTVLLAASQDLELTLSAVMILASSSLFCIIKSYHFRSNELLSWKRNEAEKQ